MFGPHGTPAATGPQGHDPKRIMVIYGTRPEAVKVAPLIQALQAAPLFTPVVAVTAQHRSMLDQVNEVFGVTPDFDLDIHQPGQTLTSITTRALAGVQQLLAGQRPDAVVVQGDTTTVFAAALAAFYEKIPVVHLEAGLRTDDPYSPYPEEINRRLATQLATLHLAPTATSKANLLAENVDPATVVVTGNTVIDALLWTSSRELDYGHPALADLDDSNAPVLLVTAHRRESWGASGSSGGVPGARQPAGARGGAARRRAPAQRHGHRAAGLRRLRPADEPRHGHPDRQRRRPGGGPQPGQAGAGDAGDHRAAGGGRGRHGPARRHRRGPHRAGHQPVAHRSRGLRGAMAGAGCC